MFTDTRIIRKTTIVAVIVMASWAAGVVRAESNTTLRNMQAAYNGESNAQVRYLAFAKQADAEGYSQVASLFRAAATAEQLHARNHAEVIRKLGGEPTATIETPAVKTTAENLKAAVAGESYERDTMYPDFIKQARTDRQTDALRSLNYARNAEMSHAKFYQQALDNLDQWRSGTRDFYVCQICGETLTAMPVAKCPSCFKSKDNFKLVQ
ncbi:MAG: rubrerythrin family protein [Phycisphaerales bacterium]